MSNQRVETVLMSFSPQRTPDAEKIRAEKSIVKRTSEKNFFKVDPAKKNPAVWWICTKQPDERRLTESDRPIMVLQTIPLATWVRRHDGMYYISCGPKCQ